MFRLSFLSHMQVVNEISYLKAVSIAYWNIRELQLEDGLKWKAETFSCHCPLNII